MAVTMTDSLRRRCEEKIYVFFDKMDKSHTNSEYYKKIFAGMNNNEFLKFVSLRFPYRFHHKPWVTEPTIKDIKDALNFLGVPLSEKIYLPHLYRNKDGKPVTTKPALVLYYPLKKMQQFVTHKNNIAIEIEKRDMKTGLLIGEDKGGKASDRELEALGVLGLESCMKEFSTLKADSMESKSKAYNTISTTGQLSLKDAETDNTDSASLNLLSVYLLGANIMSNIVAEDYMLPYTMKEKKKSVERI